MKKRVDGEITVNGAPLKYVAFGKGERNLVVLPGLSDGLTTVAGKSVMLSWYYRKFARCFRVYVFSRRRDLPDSYTTREMASDQAVAMHALGLEHAYLLGVSQGGMIAQFLAIDNPELAAKLILAVTTPEASETLKTVVSEWINLARAGDYRSLMIDMMEKTYTEQYLRKLRLVYPIITHVGRPKDFHRFLIQAQACIDHSAAGELDRIRIPTLCIGGADDHIVGPGQSEALAASIPGAILQVYPALGHGAFGETKAFDQRMLEFLLRS